MQLVKEIEKKIEAAACKFHLIQYNHTIYFGSSVHMRHFVSHLSDSVHKAPTQTYFELSFTHISQPKHFSLHFISISIASCALWVFFFIFFSSSAVFFYRLYVCCRCELCFQYMWTVIVSIKTIFVCGIHFGCGGFCRTKTYIHTSTYKYIRKIVFQ